MQAAAAAARSLGSGEKGLALRASLKGASAQRGRGKRTKNPPKTATKTHTKIKRNLKNKARKHGAKPPASPAAPQTHSERRSRTHSSSSSSGSALPQPRRAAPFIAARISRADARGRRAGGRQRCKGSMTWQIRGRRGQGESDRALESPGSCRGNTQCSGCKRLMGLVQEFLLP